MNQSPTPLWNTILAVAATGIAFLVGYAYDSAGSAYRANRPDIFWPAATLVSVVISTLAAFAATRLATPIVISCCAFPAFIYGFFCATSTTIIPYYLGFAMVAAPFVVAASIAPSVGAYLFLGRGRVRPGHCRECGYNLRGLPAGRACPECGEALHSEPDQHHGQR